MILNLSANALHLKSSSKHQRCDFTKSKVGLHLKQENQWPSHDLVSQAFFKRIFNIQSNQMKSKYLLMYQRL